MNAPRRRTGPRRQPTAQFDAFARAELLAIARHRFGRSTLPENADGERFLEGLLWKGLPGMQILDFAPWASRRGIDHYVEKAKANRRIPNADRLGELIEFEFDELKAMKRCGYSVRHVAPCDAQAQKVRDFWKAKRRHADRKRKQRKREQEQSTTTSTLTMPTLTKRAALVREAIDRSRWTSVPVIMKAVAPTLRGQRNRKLAPHALRLAVRRGIDELVACGLAEAKTDIGEHGVATRFARLTN